MSLSFKHRQKLVFCLAISASMWTVSAQADALVDQGKQIYTQGAGAAIACITCHGQSAEGMAAANFPFLAGQGADYLTEQLLNFASGARENEIMKPIAKALDADQVKAVLAYIQTMPLPFDADKLATSISNQPAAKDTGAWIANRGDWANNVPACVQCHGVAGTGVAPHFPAIVGLSKNYIIEQFDMWRNGKRAAGPLDLMANIANRTSDTQIEAVAEYFANLPKQNGGQ